MASLKIISSGLLSSLQDLGRKSMKYYAIPSSGAMDPVSLRQANSIVGVSLDNPCIEFNFMPASIEFQSDCLIALTGANMQFKINSIPVEMFEPLQVKNGDILSGSWCTSNARSYMSICGKFIYQKIYGSVSQLHGIDREDTMGLLKEGDVLHWTESEKVDSTFDAHPLRDEITSITACKGPEFDYLSDNSIDLLLTQKFSLSSESSRMGARLNEKFPNNPYKPLDHSVPVLPGFVQLTPSGDLIVLLQDAQSTGGYPRILYLKEEELVKFNQIGINQKFSFTIQQ